MWRSRFDILAVELAGGKMGMRVGIDWSRVQRPEKNPLGPSSDVSGVWGNRENTGSWDNEGTGLSFRDGTYVFTR